LLLCLTKHHAMKAYWEWRYSSSHYLTSALDGSEWSASRPSRSTRKGTARGNHWIGDWVGPSAVLDAMLKRKILSPRRESKPRTPIVQSVAQRYTDWTIAAHISDIPSLKIDQQWFIQQYVTDAKWCYKLIRRCNQQSLNKRSDTLFKKFTLHSAVSRVLNSAHSEAFFFTARTDPSTTEQMWQLSPQITHIFHKHYKT
jgi:hypothetical protein